MTVPWLSTCQEGTSWQGTCATYWGSFRLHNGSFFDKKALPHWCPLCTNSKFCLQRTNCKRRISLWRRIQEEQSLYKQNGLMCMMVCNVFEKIKAKERFCDISLLDIYSCFHLLQAERELHFKTRLGNISSSSAICEVWEPWSTIGWLTTVYLGLLARPTYLLHCFWSKWIF